MVQCVVKLKPIISNWKLVATKQVILSEYLLEVLWKSFTPVKHLNHKLHHVVIRLTCEECSASH